MTNLMKIYQGMFCDKFPQLAGEELPEKLAVYLAVVAHIVRQLESGTEQVAADGHVREVSSGGAEPAVERELLVNVGRGDSRLTGAVGHQEQGGKPIWVGVLFLLQWIGHDRSPRHLHLLGNLQQVLRQEGDPLVVPFGNHCLPCRKAHLPQHLPEQQPCRGNERGSQE